MEPATHRIKRLLRTREEVHRVPVEVAASAVVVPGGPGVGVAGEDLRLAQRHPASSALVIAAWRSECGLLGIVAGLLPSPTSRRTR